MDSWLVFFAYNGCLFWKKETSRGFLQFLLVRFVFRCLDYLLDNGVDPTLKNCRGYSAVHYAAACGNKQHLELVSFVFPSSSFNETFVYFRLRLKSSLFLLQLLEISFNCLEEAESNIPVSPLHLAVSILIIIMTIIKGKKFYFEMIGPFASLASGLLWSLWSTRAALWDFSEFGCSRHSRANCPSPGCSEGLFSVCGGPAGAWRLLRPEGAQTQVDSSARCRWVNPSDFWPGIFFKVLCMWPPISIRLKSCEWLKWSFCLCSCWRPGGLSAFTRQLQAKRWRRWQSRHTGAVSESVIS